MVKPPDPVLLGHLASYDPHVSRLALAAREAVLEEAPDAIESIFRGYATVVAFSFTGKPLKDGFCHVVTYSTHVNLGFNRGALLPDPAGALAGTGKLIRHITIKSESNAHHPVVRGLIQAAIEQVNERRGREPSRPSKSPRKRKSRPKQRY